MKKYLLPSALILAFGLSLALAQNITKSVQLSQSTGTIGYDTSNNVYFPNHILNYGKPPVLTACVTGGSPKVVGTDFSGTITAGSTASTSCVITFATAFVTAPNCVVGWASGPLAAMSWTESTTALTITQTSNASSVINYICSSQS
jgi:hypothetical protein